MWGEAKDPAIKLFGKTIPLLGIQQKDRSCSTHQYKNIDLPEERERRQGNGEEGEGDDDDDDEQCEKELLKRDPSSRALGEGSGNGESPRMPPLDEENSSPNNSKAREKQIEDGDRKEQKTTLKKPDKILPCPRCNSMETKFCYYNNYNVKQPRHFCKKCQRYWTAGGTMRNLPVGAGRRKSKSSFATFNNQCHHLAVAEALQSSSRQLYESMSSVLSHTEKTLISNRCHKPDAVVVPTSYANQENVFEHPGSSGKTGPTGHGVISPPFPSRVSCFLLPPALFPPAGLALPVYPIAAVAAPAAYWGCSVPASWTLVASLPQPLSANISVSTNPSSGKNSPALGKHPREESVLKPVDLVGDGEPDSAERCLWMPKTLRIDDPGEAAKNSTWATLGISKNGSKADSVSRVTLFKAFHTKAEDKDRTIETSPVLQANPAALFRSLNFLESL